MKRFFDYLRLMWFVKMELEPALVFGIKKALTSSNVERTEEIEHAGGNS